MGLSQATSVLVDPASGSVGVMSMGRSSSLPLWKTAPARTTATRCGALTARQRACGVDQLVGHGDSGSDEGSVEAAAKVGEAFEGLVGEDQTQVPVAARAPSVHGGGRDESSFEQAR